MITKLKLKSGRAPGLAPTEMAVSAVTVFVGPNNSGKSKLLLELDRYCRTGKTLEPRALVDEVVVAPVKPITLPV